MNEESCEPPVDINWQDAELAEVLSAAQYGIGEAKAELQRRELQVDTLSTKALDPALINIKWIEE
jgi:hypothetical protein